MPRGLRQNWDSSSCSRFSDSVYTGIGCPAGRGTAPDHVLLIRDKAVKGGRRLFDFAKLSDSTEGMLSSGISIHTPDVPPPHLRESLTQNDPVCHRQGFPMQSPVLRSLWEKPPGHDTIRAICAEDDLGR